MKNISLIINIVLAVAIGFLFVLFFSLRGQVKDLNSHPMASKTGNSKIVYINVDSLYSKYDMYKDMKAMMDEKQKKMEGEMAVKKNNYERNVMDYQDKAKKGLLLRSEAEKIEQQLMGDQQNLMKIGQDMQSQLADESRVENNKLINTIVDYLKEYNKNGAYQFILSHMYGGNLLYADGSLDITNDVLKGLNEKYRSERHNK
jgi:outer membrane protein